MLDIKRRVKVLQKINIEPIINKQHRINILLNVIMWFSLANG